MCKYMVNSFVCWWYYSLNWRRPRQATAMWSQDIYYKQPADFKPEGFIASAKQPEPEQDPRSVCFGFDEPEGELSALQFTLRNPHWLFRIWHGACLCWFYNDKSFMLIILDSIEPSWRLFYWYFLKFLYDDARRFWYHLKSPGYDIRVTFIS